MFSGQQLGDLKICKHADALSKRKRLPHHTFHCLKFVSYIIKAEMLLIYHSQVLATDSPT